MTYFAAISKFQDKEFKIVGSSVSKSACSRIANKKVTDVYGNRNADYSEINICEFEDLSDAREYVKLINK